MIAWQLACQNSWLSSVNPDTVCWPWENHSWERAFVRMARQRGIKTVGYQHTVVGHREWNYLPASNPDGAASLPDLILTSGPEGIDILTEYGVPPARMKTGGALRTGTFEAVPYDPDGPAFVALPFDADIARQMMEAIRPLGAQGRRFAVKTHPMTPFAFAESP